MLRNITPQVHSLRFIYGVFLQFVCSDDVYIGFEPRKYYLKNSEACRLLQQNSFLKKMRELRRAEIIRQRNRSLLDICWILDI